MQRTALLEIIDTQGEFLAAGTIVATELGPPLGLDSNSLSEPIYQTIVTGSDLSDVFLSQDQFGAIVVGFELKEDGADRFYEFTRANIGQPMAIVVDKVVISSPQINDAIANSGQIIVGSAQEARELVLQLEAGTLPAPLLLVQSASLSSIQSSSALLQGAPSRLARTVAQLSTGTLVFSNGPSVEGSDGQKWWPIVVFESGESGYIQAAELERLNEIEQRFLDQIEENPNDVQAMATLASYLANLGRTSEAIQWYERALKITPNDTALRLEFASALAADGKMPDAEVQYLRVIQAEPNNGFALLSLARLYRSWSPPRTQEAATYFQLAIERGGDSVVAQVAADELYELTGGIFVPSPQASPAPAT